MKQENFPSLKQLGYGYIKSIMNRNLNSFLALIRDKPELIYNILSFKNLKRRYFTFI